MTPLDASREILYLGVVLIVGLFGGYDFCTRLKPISPLQSLWFTLTVGGLGSMFAAANITILQTWMLAVAPTLMGTTELNTASIISASGPFTAYVIMASLGTHMLLSRLCWNVLAFLFKHITVTYYNFRENYEDWRATQA